jgi:hypothetical protein
MINIIPQSEVRLLKTPLEKDSEHTLSWSDLQDQTSYMLSKVVNTYTDFTYIRETQALVVPANYDSIYTCNYLMYRNNGFNNKYFYAFITKMEYVSENSTRIYFEIDSLQTWYFQINYNNVFIEREHVSNDTIGLHTVPENLENGEYITTNPQSSNHVNNLCLCMGLSNSNNGYLMNGQYTGINYVFFRDTNDQFAYGALNRYKDTILNNDEAIVCIFPVPINMINDIINWNMPIGDSGLYYGVLTTGNIPEAFGLGTFGGTWLNKLGNYTPRNNKLLCYPYRYLMLTNNNGANNVYKFEDFSSPTSLSFNIYGSLVPSCSFICVPNNYKGVTRNYSESLIGAKLPIACWTSDLYTNWATQNGINKELANIANESDAQIANLTGSVGINLPVFGSLREIYSHQQIPNAMRGNTNGGDINFSLGNCNFLLYTMYIKEEYARIIDEYFTKYGYKVNRVKTPEIGSRRNFNYIKTIGCNFTGEIPQEDLEKIKNIFNNGITFWHNAENFLNYSVNNDII